MIEEFLKSRAQYYSDEMQRFNKRNLNTLKNFNDAVKKYKKFKAIYDKAYFYIDKLPYGRIDSIDCFYTQVEGNLNRLFNQYIIQALKSSSENQGLLKLEEIETDIDSSFGYGFDDYISKYEQALQKIRERYNIIYKNYKSNLNKKKLDDTAKIMIDFVRLYGTDYEAIEKEKQIKEKRDKEEYSRFINSYVDMAQYYFDKKGLNIKFNKTKRIDKSALKNSLFTNITGEDVEKFITQILSMSLPNEIRLLLMDYSQLNLFEYNGLSNLYAPVISDYKTAKTSLELLKTEMNRRYDLFLKKRVKNIDSYNNDLDNSSIMPYIVVVISEICEMLKFENTREIILGLLLNCERAGIIIVGFSKLNKKNIQLMMLEDLFDIHNGYSNKYFDSDTKNEKDEIDNIDNKMDGFDFEKYTSQLLKSNGFIKVEVTQCSSDYGVDVIAYKDDIKYAIQCKKYSSPVGIKAVQEVIGSKAMNDCHVAVVLTNNTFTKNAIELAEKNNVLLWGRDKLVELIDNMNK